MAIVPKVVIISICFSFPTNIIINSTQANPYEKLGRSEIKVRKLWYWFGSDSESCRQTVSPLNCVAHQFGNKSLPRTLHILAECVLRSHFLLFYNCSSESKSFSGGYWVARVVTSTHNSNKQTLLMLKSMLRCRITLWQSANMTTLFNASRK